MLQLCSNQTLFDYTAQLATSLSFRPQNEMIKKPINIVDMQQGNLLFQTTKLFVYKLQLSLLNVTLERLSVIIKYMLA